MRSAGGPGSEDMAERALVLARSLDAQLGTLRASVSSLLAEVEALQASPRRRWLP